MKRLIVSVLFMLAVLFSVSAQQPSVSTSSTSLSVTVKRAFAQGDDVCIDLLVTSHTKWEVVSLHACKVFDDEGNYYVMSSSTFQVSDERIDVMIDDKRSCFLAVAKDIPRKVRVIVRDVDEYATAFTRMDIEWWGERNSGNIVETVIKNLPITRE